MGRLLMYVVGAVCIWPVFAFYLLRLGTHRGQYRRIALAAGLAALWPVLAAMTAGGLAVRTVRSGRKPDADAPMSQPTTTV